MTYVLSDIHGRCQRYLAMLEAIAFGPADVLYVLGDVLDRGDEGCRTLLDMMGRPNVLPILGNHELTAAVCLPFLMEKVTDQSLDRLSGAQLAALSEWIVNGGGPTLRELRQLPQEVREDLLAYIREMDLYAEVSAGGRDYVLSHAGIDHDRFSPEKPLDRYELQDFLFARPAPDQRYYPHRCLVYGHTPTRLLRRQAGEPPGDRILHREGQIAIDCGCGHGGPLGCLCLETLEEFYIE